uniref:Uncharacterized protein n=1 Tax=Neogobius melanostomus TaxID=47308 RepID=A0A8C6UFI7_9GOBI
MFDFTECIRCVQFSVFFYVGRVADKHPVSWFGLGSVAMEDSGSVRARSTENGNQDRRELLSTKPLHRFVQKEPKSLGVVILIFGCAELIMGFLLAGDSVNITSCYLYIPFWQGALFLVCGILSIYTGIHPSKKMVTVCLSMYMVSFFGILFSVGSRIAFLVLLNESRWRRYGPSRVPYDRGNLLIAIEAILFVSSLCASVLLIFLLCVARLALKSTRTQLILHQIVLPVTEAPAE